MSPQLEAVWVFVIEGASFPSGVFAKLEAAEEWIRRHSLSGLLTQYPVDIGVYDWAVGSGKFTPKRDDQSSSMFVGRFTSAHMAHHHYEDGRRLA